eukprot:jgi/Bigna1/145450/aug1.99_g20158
MVLDGRKDTQGKKERIEIHHSVRLQLSHSQQHQTKRVKQQLQGTRKKGNRKKERKKEGNEERKETKKEKRAFMIGADERIMWDSQIHPCPPNQLDHQEKLREAVDNHKEQKTLGEFMKFCSKYLEGAGGQLVDQKFLPRIVEGEVRVLMIGETPVELIHKKPVGGGISATTDYGLRRALRDISSQ